MAIDLPGFFDWIGDGIHNTAEWIGKNVWTPLTNPYGQQNFETQREDNLNKYQNTVADMEAAGFSKWSLGANGGSVQASTQNPNTGASSINLGAIAEIMNAVTNAKTAGVQRDVGKAEIDRYNAETDRINAETDAINNGTWMNQEDVRLREEQLKQEQAKLDLQQQQVRAYVESVKAENEAKFIELERREAELMELIKHHAEEYEIQREQNRIAEVEAEIKAHSVYTEQQRLYLDIVRTEMERQFKEMDHSEKFVELTQAEKRLEYDEKYRQDVMKLQKKGFSKDVAEMIANGVLNTAKFGLSLADFINILSL